MKGVSEIIAIILILMIVVALAALAYTWFSGIFGTLTTTTSNASAAASTAMTTNFRIEIAKNVSTCYNVSVVIRCLGTSSIAVNQMSAYINDVTSNITSYGGPALNPALSYGNVSTFYVTNLTSAAGAGCNAYGARLRLITATGLEQSTTIQ